MMKTIIFTVEGEQKDIRTLETCIKYLLEACNLTIPDEDVML
jgi:hypothetical protein